MVKVSSVAKCCFESLGKKSFGARYFVLGCVLRLHITVLLKSLVSVLQVFVGVRGVGAGPFFHLFIELRWSELPNLKGPLDSVYFFAK